MYFPPHFFPHHRTAVLSLSLSSSPLSSRMSAEEETHTSELATEGGATMPLPSRVVQYVVVREDLGKALGWSVGSIATQCCHASLKAVWENREDALTAQYLAPGCIDSMHKVVLKCKNETALLTLAASLKDAGVPASLWLEQPENIPTALASKPVVKEDVAPLFKKMQLYRDFVAKKEK